METKIIRTALPAGNQYYDDEALFKDGDKIQGDPLVFAYYYGNGGYEGTGSAIYQCQDGKWDHAGLGHCSCYGPLDGGVALVGTHETLDALIASFSQELRNECQAIIAALKENGCK